MDEYFALARQSTKIYDFKVDHLKAAIIYNNTKQHITEQGLTWCGYERDNSDETRKGFADGSGTSEKATIFVKTYWLLNGQYISCSCSREYFYNCCGHSGGIDDIDGEDNPVVSLTDWLTGTPLTRDGKTYNEGIDTCYFSELEDSDSEPETETETETVAIQWVKHIHMITVVTKLLSFSDHDRADIDEYTYGWKTPKFISIIKIIMPTGRK
jgi:hypothetical protein